MTAAVLTASDGVTHGTRTDESGRLIAEMLDNEGFDVVGSVVVPDDMDRISTSLRELTLSARLVVTTGGTGFGPRDVTPEATKLVIEKDAPGLVHVMFAAGLAKTPMAALSRAVAGSVGNSLILNTPGSPKAAAESLEAVLPLIPHALQLLAGDTEHR